MATLPEPSEDLCFSTDVFLEEDYSVDEFVSKCRRKVTIEHLQQDLQTYYVTLKASMIELINKDYGDFLDLSANLVGMDKQIDSIATPLSQLHQEVSAISMSMTTAIKALENKMAARAELREQKVTLNRLMYVFDATEQLEMLLDAQKEDGRSLNDLERVGVEFNKLHHYASLLAEHPTIQKLHPRMAGITNKFQNLLEGIFIHSLTNKDHEQLLHVLEIYSLIGKQSHAEELFSSYFFRPHLQKMVSLKAILSHPQGLEGVYVEVLELVSKQTQFLFEVCTGLGPESGFNFLVNGVWPEIVSLLESRASTIFSAGNPDNFHKNYTASMEFLTQFEHHCRSIAEVKRLRSHSSYSVFISKWSLPVYFQIRYQEIAGQLETQLELPLVEVNENGSYYSLQVFVTLSNCISKCWSDGIYLPSLVHRFWKLTLQLIIRLGIWLCQVFETSQKSCPVSVSIKLDEDIRSFIKQSKEILNSTILPRLVNKDINLQKLTESYTETCDTHLGSALTKIGNNVTSSLIQQCSSNLEPVQTIPRLYRRTNRDVPSRPSGYVGAIFKPLTDAAIDGESKIEWVEKIVNGVTEKYHEMTSEVLNNVKRTEDSLLKLKKNRRSLIPETTSGMSDDNKIRLQLSIDIEHYIKQATCLLPVSMITNNVALIELKKVGLLAKTTSGSTTS